MTSVRKNLAWGGVIGPIVFVAGWFVLGFQLDSYSPVSQAISELARHGRTTRAAMSVVFVIFSLAMCAFAAAASHYIHPRAGVAAATNALATIGVAAASLGSPTSDRLHFSFAAIAYVSLVALPAVSASTGVVNKKWSVAVSACTAAALVFSIVGPTEIHGLFQRIGLTLGDIWIAAAAINLIRRRL